jgi:HEAT repeat protein
MLGLALMAALTRMDELPVPAPQARLKVREGTAEALLRHAQELRYEQRWFEAAAAYRKYLAEFPGADGTATARFYLASILERDQRWDEAVSAYTEFLVQHPDQRMLGKEARLGRIHCWGIRQGHAPQATLGLVAALEDGDPEVRVTAALELAKAGDGRGVPALQQGLALPSYVDRCTMSLIALGVKPNVAAPAAAGRFLVVRIHNAGSKDEVTVRLSLAWARAIASYLSDEQIQQARKKGVNLENLKDQVLRAPKGSLLFSVEDAKSRIDVTVE